MIRGGTFAFLIGINRARGSIPKAMLYRRYVPCRNDPTRAICINADAHLSVRVRGWILSPGWNIEPTPASVPKLWGLLIGMRARAAADEPDGSCRCRKWKPALHLQNASICELELSYGLGNILFLSSSSSSFCVKGMWISVIRRKRVIKEQDRFFNFIIGE